MRKVIHLTAAHPSHYMLEHLESSSTRNGFQFEHLPKFWSYHDFGKIGKIHVLNAYLHSGLIADDQVILFTDAYDVIVGAHAQVLLDRFRAFDCGIVFGTEVNFFPKINRDHLEAEFNDSSSKWRFLNSGGYIGYAGHLKRMIGTVADHIARGAHEYTIPDDQALIQNYYLSNRSNPATCKLDFKCEIFCSLNSSVSDYKYSQGYFVNRCFNTASCVLHLNGEKGDIPVLTRYETLQRRSAQMEFTADLRIARLPNGDVICYSSSERALVPSQHTDAERLLFLVKADLMAIAIPFKQAGYLTFNPNGIITSNATEMRAWEILQNQRGVWSDAHSQPLSVHVKPSQHGELTFEAFPVEYFLDPLFEKVIERVLRDYSKF